MQSIAAAVEDMDQKSEFSLMLAIMYVATSCNAYVCKCTVFVHNVWRACVAIIIIIIITHVYM